MTGLFWSVLKSKSTFIRPGILPQAIVFGSNFVGLSYYLKHTAFLKYFKGYSERLGEYGPDEPADELNNMLNDIISKDLKDVASENTPIGLYITPGMETTHLGTLGTVYGGFVGVPFFYEFKKGQDVLDSIMVKSISYDATNTEEKELCDCFLLSNKAKKYGIARGILLVNTMQVYINAVLPFIVSMVVVLLYSEMQKSYRILSYPLYTRVLIYTAVTAFGIAFWRFLYRNVLHYYESEVEEQIVELGTDYLEGGVEFCTKELKRKSLPVEVKNDKLRIIKAIDDLISKLTPSGISVMTRLNYLQAHAVAKSEKIE